MTIKEIKDIFKLKPKVELPDDYIVTENDIEKGNIFQKFIFNDSVTKIVSGLKVVEGEICYLYPDVERIEIETDDSFPACGGEQEIIVYAYYVVMSKTQNKQNYIFIPEDKCQINALISLDNNLFSYKKPNIVNNTPNYSNENREVNIKATYYFNGDKFESYYHVIQHINSNSSWLIEKEPTDFISLSFSENNIPSNGGIVTAKVERMFSRIYCKKDSCGNIVEEKQESNLIEDITDKCLLTSSNKKSFSVNKNIITIAKQLPDAEKREAIITARYIDKTDSKALYQEEGGKTTYTYELSFENGNKSEFFDLQTSIPVEKEIPIISKQYKYVDDKYINVSNTDKLKIESDSEWVKGFVTKNNDDIFVSVKTLSTNIDKENDREAIIRITNIDDADLSITLIVSQPALIIYNEEYHCSFHANGEYTSKDIDSKDFYFESYKLLIYENGDKERVNIEEPLQTKYQYYSTDDNLLNIRTIDFINGKYYVRFNNSSSFSAKDLQIAIKLLFYLNDKLLFESDKANIIVKGTDIIDYDYELCFEGHNKYKTITWNNDNEEPELVNVNSLKHKLINGKYSGSEEIPYTIGIYDENGKEYFDDSFSIKIIQNKIFVFPAKKDKNITNTYTITQKETGFKINLTLSYQTNIKQYSLPLKVLVYNNNNGIDVWTGENGYLLIDGKQKIKLNPCWLSPTMKDNVDTAFNGIIELPEGTHTFETFNVISFGYEDKTHKECNIKEEIIVDDSTEEITLNIKT